jgi:hypothetical protein
MAWPLDEPGAAPRDKRTCAYDDRRVGNVTMTVVAQEEFPDGINYEVAKARTWSV